MDGPGFALVALAVGAALGAAAVAARRRTASGGGGDLARLEARLEVQAAELRRIADAGSVRDGDQERMRDEVAGARRALQELALRETERRERERESWDVVRRLSTVLAGGSAKGRAGENVLRQHLMELPPGMLVTDFRVNGKVVEFGLLLPDGRRLPVDSKWTAVAELEALEAADGADCEARARDVEKAVAARAREVAQYLDPALTAPVAVAAVPDAAYAVLRRAHADAFERGVVVVPYSTALPVLLFLHSLVARYGDAGDAQAALREVATILGQMEGMLENKFARAATMLANGADEMRSYLGKARGSVARGRSGVVEPVSAERGPALEAVP
ncbi:MAG TPA: DNA recombination protein RmuC [Actinomycetota bacterium]|nr:DNA recombination protein RmuC [Actinomycetota bacterium]